MARWSCGVGWTDRIHPAALAFRPPISKPTARSVNMSAPAPIDNVIRRVGTMHKCQFVVAGPAVARLVLEIAFQLRIWFISTHDDFDYVMLTNGGAIGGSTLCR